MVSTDPPTTRVDGAHPRLSFVCCVQLSASAGPCGAGDIESDESGGAEPEPTTTYPSTTTLTTTMHHADLLLSPPSSHALAALIAFIQPKIIHAQNRPFIERSLDEAERAFPQFAEEFERAHHGYRLQTSIRAGGSISSASGSGAASPTLPVSPRARSPAGRRPSADVEASLGTASAATTAVAARDRVRQPPGAVRVPVGREVTETHSEDPPPLYAADDPDPESTRLLEQRLAAEAEAADVVVGSTAVAAAAAETATHGATSLDIVGIRSDDSALRAPSPPPSLLSVSAPAYSHLDEWTLEPAPQYVPPAGTTTATTPELSVPPSTAASRRISLPEGTPHRTAAAAMSSPLMSTVTSASNRIRRSDPVPAPRPAPSRIEPAPRPRIGSAAMPLAPVSSTGLRRPPVPGEPEGMSAWRAQMRGDGRRENSRNWLGGHNNRNRVLGASANRPSWMGDGGSVW